MLTRQGKAGHEGGGQARKGSLARECKGRAGWRGQAEKGRQEALAGKGPHLQFVLNEISEAH